MPVLPQAMHMLPVGGDAVVKKKPKKAPLHGNVVKTIKVGNTTINFCDDCIVDTQEETNAILNNFLSIGWSIIDKLAAEGKWEEAEAELLELESKRSPVEVVWAKEGFGA